MSLETCLEPSVVSKEHTMTPHYHLVPREYGANLKFREEVINAGLGTRR